MMAKKKRGRHSPAGYAWLMEQARKTKPVYFKNIRKPTVETQLRRQGLSDAELRSLGMGKKLKRKK
jgi:hypothetical protein